MSRILTVAAAQTGPVGSDDLRSMVPAAIDMIEKAAAAKVDILTFCELFLSPFFPNRLTSEFEHHFTTADGEVVQTLAAAARRRKLAVILPFAERDSSGFYNSALVLDAEGRTVGTYRKTHIPAYFPDDKPGGTGSYEMMYFTPGRDLPVFVVNGTTIGIQICNDRLYPEASRVLALKGAEIIFMPICYSVYSDPEHRQAAWDLVLRTRAYENGVFVVAANKVGAEGVRSHLGRSMIVDPRGTILVEAGTRDPELIVQRIDLEEAELHRKVIPWWRNRRPELYGELAR